MRAFSEFLAALPPASSAIVSLSLMLFAGFAMTRITKKFRLPNVTAYIFTGILLGPYALDLVPKPIIENTDFLSDIALAFIAFATGEAFRVDSIRKNGVKVLIITLFETLTASACVFAALYFVLGLSLTFSVVLAALASTTASASTLMTIRQTGASGEYIETLLQVIVIDNLIGLLAFSMSVSLAASSGSSSFLGVLKLLAGNIGVLILGGVFGLFLRLLMPNGRSNDNRLIISISLLFAFCAICALMDISPMLGCMAMGMVYINISGDDRLFMQLNYFSPPILLLFFVRSGLNFDLSAMFSGGSIEGVKMITISLVYAAARLAGKYTGAYAGCAAAGKSRKIRMNLGLALIPQAGVALGLSAYAARMIGGEAGASMQTALMAALILYEIIGPVLSKFSMQWAGAFSNRIEDVVPIADTGGRSELELLIARIDEIQQSLPPRTISEENEAAFLEAAEEYRGSAMRTGLLRRRF